MWPIIPPHERATNRIFCKEGIVTLYRKPEKSILQIGCTDPETLEDVTHFFGATEDVQVMKDLVQAEVDKYIRVHK
jgi:hypothetical protein